MFRAAPAWLILLLVTPLNAQLQAPPQPSSALEEIRAAVTSGDYRGALNKIDKQLFPSFQDPAGRYELLMLKGECQLQLKDRIGAGTAFKSAAKAASNVGELAAAQANALIVDRSTSGVYRPRFGSGEEPIDIMLIDSRKRAMMSFQAELSSQYKSQIESALRADKLPPIEAVFPRVADMFFLETFAKGEATETGKIVRDLGTHAYKLMQGEVSKCAGRIDYLTQVANSASENGRGWNTGRMGLTSQQRDEVKQTFTYLTKIRDRGTEYRRIAARLGGDEQKWDALVADTVDTMADAELLYNDR
jgi:hypothetical protein